MIQSVKDALFGARLFFFIVNGLAILILFSYDTDISKQITQNNYIYAIYMLFLVLTSTYLFLTCGDYTQPDRDSINSDLLLNLPSDYDIELEDMKKQNAIQENQPDIPIVAKFDCLKCNKIQSYRTRHCDLCEKCIYKFDHHCFWIGSCVGELNHRRFMALIFFQTWTNITYLQLFWNTSYNYKYNNDDQSEYLVCLLFVLISLLFACFTGVLVLYHTFLICTNQTSWEHSKRKRITYLQIYPKGYYPFNQGVINNIKLVFCHQNKPQDWKLPSLKEADDYIANHFNIFENKYYDCCSIDDKNN